MKTKLAYVQETIEFRKSDIEGNEFETNNLLMDDILIALGYNKRREPGVKAVYSGEVDWEVSCRDENRFTITVYGYGSDEPKIEQLQGALSFTESNNYTFLLVTDGKCMSIYNNGILLEHIDDIYSSDNIDTVSKLSDDMWEPNALINNLETNITREKVVEILIDNKLALSNMVVEALELKQTFTNINAADKQIMSILSEKENSTEVRGLEAKGENGGNTTEAVKSEVSSESIYREKISTLTIENQTLKTQLQECKVTLDEIEKQHANREDKKITLARQLLEAVDDNKNAPRAYVGVVNSKLFQIVGLSKFVGTCIQELYATVSFELMHLLFDGDIFKIIQPAVRGDLLINTKSYDLDTSNLNEEEVISRLKSLFGKFEKVAFMCKTIGTREIEPITVDNQEEQPFDTNEQEYVEQTYIEEEQNITYSEQTEYTEEQENTFTEEQTEYTEEQEGTYSEQTEYTEEQTEYTEEQDITCEEQDVTCEEQENTFIEEPVFEEPEILTYDTNSSGLEANNILMLPLSEIGRVLWSENNPLAVPLAVGFNDKTFRIDSDNIFETTLISIINMSNNILEALNTLSSTDLTETSANIHLGCKSETDEQILQTNYYTDTTDMKRYISVLLTLAELIEVDSFEACIYFEIDEDAEYVEDLKQYYLSIEDLEKLFIEEEVEVVECTDETHSIISGESLDKLVKLNIIRGAAEELIESTVAVRTAYMTSSLRTTTDVSKAFETCMEKISSANIIGVLEKINTLTDNKIILKDGDIITDSSIKFTANNKVYYVDALRSNEVIMAMYILHDNSVHDNVIDIRVRVNSTLYNQYKTKIVTNNCYDYFARQLICNIMEGKTKVINK